ncbi:hypothetical protein J2T57_001577 [Natronocella acetinitrilica]|uniref:Cyclic di-GMP-binding protein n=1 Tax=Natronocella acetinitrilica TaxID=414046 RepID=A0AAE3G2E3_9GAMM|nr:cellulose biosynthesis cyclic di-GMP-binding regulatory protein BcsB [Natronocella acetinitrilica]MCP1674475.1 hypothetical protein [Natronocella acetinitrilica]
MARIATPRALLGALLATAALLLAPALAHAEEPRRGVLADGMLLAEPGTAALRLAGEYARADLALMIPDPERLAEVALALPLQSAVDVLGEASVLTLAVNGEALSRVPLAAFGEQRTLRLRLRPEAFTAGENLLTLEAIHHHRVDCSLEATHELWSAIDLAGARLTPVYLEGTTPSQGGLELLLAARLGGNSLTVIRPEAVPVSAFLAQAGELVQALSLRLARGATPAIDVLALGQRQDTGFDPLIPAGGGRDQVLIGTREALRPHLEQSLHAEIRGPYTRIWQQRDGAGLSLIVSGRDEAEVREAIRALAERAPLRARTPRIERAGRYRFDQLGHSFHPGYAREKVSSLRFLLPAGFAPEARRGASPAVTLAYAVAANVDADLDLFVNGRWVSRERLHDPAGRVTESARIELPWRHFRAGENTIELRAALPREPGVACPLSDPSEVETRFMLYGDSTLHMPAFSALPRHPDLASALHLGYPGDGARRLDLVAIGGGNAAQAAVLNLAARLAHARGHLVPVAGHIRLPPPGATPMLAAGTVHELPEALLADSDTPRGALSRLLPAREAPEGAQAGRTASDERERFRERLGIIDPLADAAGAPGEDPGWWRRARGSLADAGFLREAQALPGSEQHAALIEVAGGASGAPSRLILTAGTTGALDSGARGIAALPAEAFAGGALFIDQAGAHQSIAASRVQVSGSGARGLAARISAFAENNVGLMLGLGALVVLLLAALLHLLLVRDRRRRLEDLDD